MLRNDCEESKKYLKEFQLNVDKVLQLLVKVQREYVEEPGANLIASSYQLLHLHIS